MWPCIKSVSSTAIYINKQFFCFLKEKSILFIKKAWSREYIVLYFFLNFYFFYKFSEAFFYDVFTNQHIFYVFLFTLLIFFFNTYLFVFWYNAFISIQCCFLIFFFLIFFFENIGFFLELCVIEHKTPYYLFFIY